MNKLFFLFLILPVYLVAQDNTVKDRDFFDALTKAEREIIVNRGTERAFSGDYVDLYEAGLYVCKACNNPLFESESKFKSNCGWPSFDDEINNSLIRIQDNSYSMQRVEICCANCKGHLGHVFEGEELTKKNLRHCVNSISIKFISKN
jgi:peptide-methionine (R)-S-oxide reductase